MQNLYWPVYKNLESEVLALSFNIHFDDMQFDYIASENNLSRYTKTPPYSLKIGDLLIRCCTEIEALIQEITRDCDVEIKNMQSFNKEKGISVASRLVYIDSIWRISKKVIQISCPNMFLEREENKSFAPFEYIKGDDNDFIVAYNTIKHDRNINTIYKGNIRFLLRAMAALYLLNLYYKGETINIGRSYMRSNDFDNRVGSEIFSVLAYRATALRMEPKIDDSCIENIKEDLDKSTYIIKYDNESLKNMHKGHYLDRQASIKKFNSSPIIKTFLSENPEYKDELMTEICLKVGGNSLLAQIFSFDNRMRDKNTCTEAVINKHHSIYPLLEPLTDETVNCEYL